MEMFRRNILERIPSNLSGMNYVLAKAGLEAVWYMFVLVYQTFVNEDEAVLVFAEQSAWSVYH